MTLDDNTGVGSVLDFPLGKDFIRLVLAVPVWCWTCILLDDTFCVDVLEPSATCENIGVKVRISP